MNRLYAACTLLLALGTVTACDETPVGQDATDHTALFHRERPIAAQETEGFGNGRLLVFDYTQNFFCPPAAATGILPCAVGPVPAFPNALNINPAKVPDLFVIVPFFEKVNPLTDEPELQALAQHPVVDVQCPEPGAPFGTCTLHPPTLVTPLGTIPLPNHSHVVRATPGGSVPWDIFVILVTDASVWPDKDGNCPARSGCLTSVEAVQALNPATQTFGGTGILPSTLFLFFGVHNLR